MTDANIGHLCPQLQAIYTEWLENCTAVGLKTHAIVTFRSTVEQNTAKAKGLSNACGGQSPHNCCGTDGAPASKAFDFAIFDDDGSYVTDGLDDRYKQAATIGKRLGLVWGGDWIHFKDYDHLELPNWKDTV